MTWQPIATAPKDRRQSILVYQPDVDKHGVERFYKSCMAVAHWDETWRVSHVSGWEWEADLESEEITHWMPLPEPPK